MSAPELGEGEEVLWQRQLTKGVFKKQVVAVERITNYRINQNEKVIGFGMVEDIVVMNRHSVSSGSSAGVITGRYGARTMVGSGSSKSHQVGDLVFMYQGKPFITFQQVTDPNGISDLLKSAWKHAKKMIEER